MIDINWEKQISSILSDAEERQKLRDVSEKTILDWINDIELSAEIMMLVIKPEDADDDARLLVEKHGNGEDFLALIDGILTRNAEKFQELFRWNLAITLSSPELIRRKNIVKIFVYRRMVLKQAYRIITGRNWIVQEYSPEDFVQDRAEAKEESRTLDFDEDYTSKLE